MQQPNSYGVDSTVSKVEIRISCRNLVRLDVLSESDPLVRVEQFDSATGRWMEMGRTEWQQNQKNPNFAKCISMDYCFEKVQKLRFQVFDIDRPDASLSGVQDFIGETTVTLGDILGSKGGTLSRDLQNPRHPARKNGIIIIRAEEVNADAANSIVSFRFSGSHLDKKDFFGKSDPYLEIYRSNPGNGQWILVHKTEVIKKTLDPTWRPFEIDASRLCQGDFNRQIMFKVWDWDSDGGHDLIGITQTTLNEMIKGKRHFALIEPDIQRKKRGYKDSGTLNVHQVDVRRVHSFLEYIAGGCQLRLAVAIDFTASNGNPADPKSLHYRNPSGEPNEYLKAIMAVGDIVASYDQTKQFPTYGFGAKIPPANEVSHCFHVNMNPSNPECIGIENVIGAYQHCLNYVKLSGPTNFAPIIKQVATIARSTPIQQQVYWILLMITDGVISDMERTISEIVDASDLPFSIIIVGVGNADFKDMDALDSDDRLLRTRTGKTATRDIVQFVPFRDFKRKHYSELARATLAELPRQLTDYYKQHNIAPNPRPAVPMTQAGLQIPLTQAGLQVQQGGAPPPQQWGGPQGGPPPQQGGYPTQGGPPPQGQWGGPQGGPPPQQGGWGGPQGYPGGPPPQSQWGGAPPQSGYPAQGGPPPQGQWGGPQGGPPPQQGGPGYPTQGGPPPQGGPAYPHQATDRQTPSAAAGPSPGGPGTPAPSAAGPSGYPGGQSSAAAGGSGGYPGGYPGGPAGGPQQGGPAGQGGPGGYPGGPQQGGPGGYPGGPAGGPQQGGPGGYPASQYGGPAAGGPPPQHPGSPAGGPSGPGGQPGAVSGGSGGYPGSPQQGGPGGYPGGPQQGGSGGYPGGPAGGPQQGGPGGYPTSQYGGPAAGGPPPQHPGSPAGPAGGPPTTPPAQGEAPKQGSEPSAAGQPQPGGYPGGPQQGGWGGPQQGGWGGPQQQQQQWGGPQQGGWGGPQQQQQWGGPQQGGWGGPQQGGWGGPQQGGWGGPQQQGGWGGPQQQWGGPQGGPPPQQGGWGGPQQQWGGPQQQQQQGGASPQQTPAQAPPKQ